MQEKIKYISAKVLDIRNLAKILLVVTLCSICLTSGLYARYSSGDTGDNHARAAQFVSVSASETGLPEGNLLPGDSVPYQAYATLTSSSETSHRVFMDVTVPVMTSGGTATELISFDPQAIWSFTGKTESEGSVVYHYVCSEESVTGTVCAFDGNIRVADYIEGMPDAVDICVAFTAEQID